MSLIIAIYMSSLPQSMVLATKNVETDQSWSLLHPVGEIGTTHKQHWGVRLRVIGVVQIKEPGEEVRMRVCGGYVGGVKI